MYGVESELNIRRAELSIARSQIADRELELITILESLIDFRSRYSSVLRDLYQRLDHLNHEISKLTTDNDPIIPCVTPDLCDAPEPLNIARTTNLVILVEPSASRRCAKSDLASLFRHARPKYACRAGSTTAFSFGDDVTMLDKAGWYRRNSAGRTGQVGQKSPNAWGLYDMHGNVLEWCTEGTPLILAKHPSIRSGRQLDTGVCFEAKAGTWLLSGADLRSDL